MNQKDPDEKSEQVPIMGEIYRRATKVYAWLGEACPGKGGGCWYEAGPFVKPNGAQDTDGENPYIDTKDVLKLLIVGDSAVRLLVTLGARSAW
jgi:hypothetical protein